MIEKLMTMLVGILLALAGWSLSRTFELSTIQAVHEDKVHTLQQQVLKLEDQVDGMMDKDKKSLNNIKNCLTFSVIINLQQDTITNGT